jgi:hypothetical protein
MLTSIRRTLIPVIVGALMASAAGPYLDEALVTEALVATFTALYYVAFRLLERAGYGWATVMLGGGSEPEYTVDTGVLAEVSVADQSDED